MRALLRPLDAAAAAIPPRRRPQGEAPCERRQDEPSRAVSTMRDAPEVSARRRRAGGVGAMAVPTHRRRRSASEARQRYRAAAAPGENASMAVIPPWSAEGWRRPLRAGRSSTRRLPSGLQRATARGTVAVSLRATSRVGRHPRHRGGPSRSTSPESATPVRQAAQAPLAQSRGVRRRHAGDSKIPSGADSTLAKLAHASCPPRILLDASRSECRRSFQVDRPGVAAAGGAW